MDNEKVFNEVSGLVNEMLELVRNYDVAGLEKFKADHSQGNHPEWIHMLDSMIELARIAPENEEVREFIKNEYTPKTARD